MSSPCGIAVSYYVILCSAPSGFKKIGPSFFPVTAECSPLWKLRIDIHGLDLWSSTVYQSRHIRPSKNPQASSLYSKNLSYWRLTPSASRKYNSAAALTSSLKYFIIARVCVFLYPANILFEWSRVITSCSVTPSTGPYSCIWFWKCYVQLINRVLSIADLQWKSLRFYSALLQHQTVESSNITVGLDFGDSRCPQIPSGFL